jgi:hypothetical protein
VTVSVVNEWASSVGQGVTFTSITSSLQSCVLQLDSTYNVGAGSGTPTAGNWLFVLASWTQYPAIEEVHIGVSDDIRSWYREYPASSASGNTRTAIAYTPNTARAPGYVYVAPDGQVAALTVLVVEVSGLGPWDTVVTGSPDSNYAAAATTLALSLASPGASSFFIGAAGGDSTAATQAFAPSGYTALHTVSQSDGSDQLASNVLTSAYLATSSSAQSVSATAGSATDLSGMLLGVLVTGTSPIPAGQNPAWPYMVFEAGFGSGFNTPDSEVTWTALPGRLWSWDETTGIKFNLGQLQSTDLQLELDNYDAALTSTNASSPYYPDVQPGTPFRLRAALGTLGGVTVNRWYVLQRNAAQWGEGIDEAYRRYCEVAGTDLWAALSDTPPTFYRSEIYADGPYAWWPMDDQPGTSGVLPVSLLNAAVGNTNTLNVVLSPNGGTSQVYETESGYSGEYIVPPGVAIYTVGADAGWLFGDPQGSPASLGTGNPVTSTPGSAAWQASGQAGNTGSYGWFLSCNDSSFPALSGGITVEIWFSYQYYGSATGIGTASGGNAASPVTQQPYNTPLTIWELATGSEPVAILQLSTAGNLNLITYNGATGTSHSIYSTSDLRGSAWHMVTAELTATTWQVWLDGGAGAYASGTATGMTSAWAWLIANGDLGTHGGSSAGTGLVHGGNVSLAHLAVYPYQLPFYRVLAHYWAGVTAFGQMPAPTAVTVTWSGMPGSGSATNVAQNATAKVFNPDGTPSFTDPVTTTYKGNVSASAVVTATAGSVTSGPSAWASGADAGNTSAGSPSSFQQLFLLWISWTGVAPSFNLYTSASVGSETEAAVVNGNGDSFNGGFGASASGVGVAQASGGSGASPPTSPSAIGDTVGQRIERLMRAGLATSPNRCIDPASLLVQAPGSAGGGVQAGAAIQAIQQSDSGFLAVDNLNNLFYWQRPHLAAQYSSPVWVLGPDTGSGQTPYYREEIRWITDPQRVWNAIGITPLSPTGAALPEITPTNASAVNASQEAYGAQPLAITSWLQSQSEMLSQANWLFANYGTPQRRVEKVKVDAAPYAAAWELIMGVNVGDTITLADWQIGDGGTVHTYRVTEIERKLSFGTHDSDITGHVVLTCDYEPSSYWS